MRRFLIGWILIVLLLPFAAAWIYSEWSEKNQQIEQESSQLQIDVQTVSGVQRMGTSDFLIGAIAGQIPAEFEVETLKRRQSWQEAVYTNRPEIDIIFRLRIRG